MLEIPTQPSIKMRLLVLAGGLGTRLKSAVPDVPKPLAPINGTPFLSYQLMNWYSQGIRNFTFVLHHQASNILSFLQSEECDFLKDCSLNWVIENELLGTGGAIANAVCELGLTGDFLLTNADTWLGGGIKLLINAPPRSMIVVKSDNISRYGEIEFNNNFVVTNFFEKRNIACSGWVNSGMLKLNSDLFLNWNRRPFSLERELFHSLVDAQLLTAIPFETEFIDIGIPEDYWRFCEWVQGGRKTPL